MNFKDLAKHFKGLTFLKLEPALEKKFKDKQRKGFVSFLRSALLFGVFAYLVIVGWSFFADEEVSRSVLYARLGMIGVFIVVMAASFIPKFYLLAQQAGMVMIMALMGNIIWTQSVIEASLEEGYGMLVMPGTEMSMIVFSGAEMGYGALLTPLLLLPIAFTAMQTLIISLITIALVNYGMGQSELPSAFVETSNSIFIAIGVFSTLLSFLVNQQRRQAFMLSEDLKDALDKAEEASMAKSNFLSTMSHEVRTPLHGILGMAGLLRDTRLDNQQNGYLKNVQYSGETLLNMLNDILDFSKMEAGKFEIEKHDIDFKQVLESVISLMEFRAEEKGIALVLETEGPVPEFVHTDPTRLRQILLNLLSNAIKFTDEGSVKLRVSCADGVNGGATQTRFEVIDTGIGISKENQKNLFQEFSQVENTVSKGYGGTGLGLSICFKLVELLEGSIHVDSKEGKGSNFWFEIPLEEADAAAKQQSEGGQEFRVTSLSILVADDEEINRQIANDFLIKDGHKVTSAKDGEDAIEIIKENPAFDLIFMDMRMPGMGGLETTRAIKSWGDDKSNTPVIGMTANNAEADINRCTEAGMIDVLTKPYNLQKVRQILVTHFPDKSTEVTDDEAGGIADGSGNDKGSALLDHEVFQELEESFGTDYTAEFIRKGLVSTQAHVASLAKAIEQNEAEQFLEYAHKLKRSLCILRS